MKFDFDTMSIEEINALVEKLTKGIDGFERDLRDAAAAARAGAERGDAQAQCSYGSFLMDGSGVDQDREAAFALWEKSAEQDYAPAMHKLGLCFFSGLFGLSEDKAKAIDYFSRAAEAGYCQSMMHLYAIYAAGTDVERDETKSNDYLRRAADAGFSPACVIVGTSLLGGSEEERNEGVALILKAAEDGDQMGQLMYGLLCEKGACVEKNLSEAAGWYRRAAKAGNAEANEALIRLGFPGMM